MKDRLMRKAFVLLLTFMVMVTLTLTVVSFLLVTSSRLRQSGYDLESAQAFWLAEAGLQDVIQKLVNDSDYRDSPTTVTESLGQGTYSVTVSKADTTYTLASTGSVGRISRKITENVAATSAIIERGIHADGAHLKFDDSSGTINGNVSCATSVLPNPLPAGMTINGTITQNPDQDKIFPTLDIAQYYTIADSLGQVDTRKTFANATYTGVWYITQEAVIGDNATIDGTIICESNIIFDGEADNITITPSNNYPALYAGNSITSTDTGAPSSRTGLQNSTINGLIMSSGDILFDYMNQNTANTVTFNGTMLADGNIQIQDGSNFTINYDSGVWDPSPLGFSWATTAGITEQGDWNEVVP